MFESCLPMVFVGSFISPITQKLIFGRDNDRDTSKLGKRKDWADFGKILIGIQGFLGRLFDIVNLTKPVSNVRPYMRTSVRPQNVSSISVKFGV